MAVESRAGTEADHLTVCAVQTSVICALQNYLHWCLSGGLFVFSYWLLQNGKVSLSLSLSFLKKIFLDQTTLHRHRCSLVVLQARMMPGFHGDGGAKCSRRPVCTAFPFLLSSALILLLDQHAWWAAAPQINNGWHTSNTHGWIYAQRLQGVLAFSPTDRKVKGRQLRETFV